MVEAHRLPDVDSDVDDASVREQRRKPTPDVRVAAAGLGGLRVEPAVAVVGVVRRVAEAAPEVDVLDHHDTARARGAEQRARGAVGIGKV